MNVTELLEALVLIPSQTGGEEQAVAFMQRRAAADGFQVIEDAAGNFVAEAGHGDSLVLVIGQNSSFHMVIWYWGWP